MKKIIFTIAFLIGFIGFSQNGINYKAIVKDATGNLVANTLIRVDFAILQGMAQTNVYTGSHTPTTDANGLIILNIGEGTLLSGDFTTIDWGSDDHFLNVKVDTGNGLVDMGITEFKTVPYALSAANVSGLEALDEGNGVGHRFIGRDPANYGTIGLEALDLSNSPVTSSLYGATGDYSAAIGLYARANGLVSMAIGPHTIATGQNSPAIGSNTTALGDYSSAFGFRTSSMSYVETAMGVYNTDYTPVSTFTWDDADRLFVIGNGRPDGTPNSGQSDAFTILKNGTITAPSFDISEITDDKALITKEYAEANIASTGLEAVNEGVNIGYRLIGKDPADYGNIGNQATDLSSNFVGLSPKGATGNYSLATGFRTFASGAYSTALGSFTTASGAESTALGSFTTASAEKSTAFGSNNLASGIGATAFGEATWASGDYSSASGINTVAKSFATTVVGSNNVDYTPLSTSAWNPLDRLFVVGNGEPSTTTSDALIILKNGTITAPSFDISEITDDKALITKEYADVFAVLEKLDEGNGNGFRIRNVNPAAYGAIGLLAVDLSFSNEVSPSNGATGDFSFASGLNNKATGDNSTVLGFESIASSYVETAIGSFNTFYSANSTTAWDANDRLFVVGNGANIGAESNALTVYKNGKIAIGNVVPDVKLHIEGGVDAGIANGTGYVVIGDLTGQNMVIDQNEIIARLNGANSTLFLNQPGGDVWAGGALVHSSDKRLKREISDLEYGLDEVLQLQPKQYFWKNRSDQKQESLGLIAQDVRDIINNIVHEADDELKTLSVSYTELIPVLINAIQEQQIVIENQESKLNRQDLKINEIVVELNQIQELVQRDKHIENTIKPIEK